MPDKQYTLETLKQICKGLDDKRPSVAKYFEHHKLRSNGFWVKTLSQRRWPQMSDFDREWLEWHPTGDLDAPALPIPFTARQLTAFALGGKAAFLLELGTDLAVLRGDETLAEFRLRFGLTAAEAEAVLGKSSPPELLDSWQLDKLGANADSAREVLREMHRLHAECVARFGSTDKGVRDAANWLLADGAEAPNTLPLETSQMATAKSVEDDLSALPTADAGSTHTEVKTDRCLDNKDHGPMPLTTGHIAFCFDGLRWTEAQWKKPLGDRPNWLKSCVQSPGKQGVRETLWNPVCIGAALVNRGHVPVNRVRAKFQTNHLLKPWLDAWRTYEFDHLETP